MILNVLLEKVEYFFLGEAQMKNEMMHINKNPDLIAQLNSQMTFVFINIL